MLSDFSLSNVILSVGGAFISFLFIFSSKAYAASSVLCSVDFGITTNNTAKVSY